MKSMLTQLLSDPQTAAQYQGMTAIDVTEVTKWFGEMNKGKEFEYSKDFPSLVAPHRVCWLEAHITQQPLVVGAFKSLAVRLHSWRVSEARRVEVLKTNLAARQAMEISGWNWTPGIVPQETQEMLDHAVDRGAECHWISYFEHYQELHQIGIMRTSCMALYLDQYGTPLADVQPMHVISDEAWQMLNQSMRIEAIMEDWRAQLLPFQFAVSLMHCKNVTLESQAAPPPAVLKKRKEKGVADVRFKTLVIEPMRKQVRREAAEGGDTSDMQRALHICRGHFKDFREGAGLFGKLHDMYWWDLQARGNARAGTIQKDYRVRAPKSEKQG